jgi:membrane protease YdiL (CAAX protease family)
MIEPPVEPDAPASVPEGQPTEVDAPVRARPLGTPDWQVGLALVSRREAVLDLALVCLVTLIVQYAPALLTVFQSRGVQLPDDAWLLVFSKCCELALAGGVAAYLVLRLDIPAATFGVRGNHPGRQMLWGLLGFPGLYVAMFLTLPLALLLLGLTSDVEREITERVRFVSQIPQYGILGTASLLAAVALHEEILFRGLLLPYLRRITGRWWSALLVSSAVFALLHVPAQGFLAAFQIMGVGLALGLFFIWSRSVLSVALAHFLFDAMQLTIARFIPDFIDNLSGT